MGRIGELFRKLKGKEGALIAYVTGGDPSLKLTPLVADALVSGGADALEIGIPFSDPIADGPVIQSSASRALAAGATPRGVLKAIKEIRKKLEVPIVALTYYNLIYRMGVERFVKLAKECGVDGMVVADLPIEESGEYRSAAQKHGLDTIFLAAPSTTSERLRRIAEHSSGFLYLVSVFGVTGAREKLQELTVKLIRRAASIVGGRLPLSVGFGISKPEHVSRVISEGADGVIVGSKFVKIIGEGGSRMLEKLEEEALKLKRATVKGRVEG